MARPREGLASGNNSFKHNFPSKKVTLFCVLSGCSCNGTSVRVNDRLVDGECFSLSPVKVFLSKNSGIWKFWCYVDENQNCPDFKDGVSFDACKSNLDY